MRANRRVDTAPEVRLRSALHRAGMRFFRSRAVAAGERRVTVDVVFSRHRVALFIDGCFWHGCPEHGTMPKSNVDYWTPKLRRNVERDAAVDEALRSSGWSVIRVWEHDVVGDLDAVVRRVAGSVQAGRAG
jgi:DNA mismatch endonuclease (patch repair protein)